MKTKREEIKELIRKIQSQQKKEAGQSSAKGSPGEPEVGGEDTEEGVEIQIQNFPVSPWGALSGLTRLPTYSLLLWHDGPIYRVGLPLPGQAWRSVRLPSCCQGLITCCWITPPPHYFLTVLFLPFTTKQNILHLYWIKRVHMLDVFAAFEIYCFWCRAIHGWSSSISVFFIDVLFFGCRIYCSALVSYFLCIWLSCVENLLLFVIYSHTGLEESIIFKIPVPLMNCLASAC